MLAKINRFLGKAVIPLNVINIVVGLLIGIAHVYLPFTSLFGLLMGIVLAISGSASIGISYWFNAKNSQRHNAAANQEEKPPLIHTRASKLFLALTLPTLLLNTASSFFGMYTGTLLLVGALGLAISPPGAIALAVVLSTTFALGTLINSWLQTHYIWESLKKPLTVTKQADPEDPPRQTRPHHRARPSVSFRPRLIKDPTTIRLVGNPATFHTIKGVQLCKNVARKNQYLIHPVSSRRIHF